MYYINKIVDANIKKELFQFHQVFLIKLSNMYLLSKDNYSLKHMRI